jgi:hypothetical protein
MGDQGCGLVGQVRVAALLLPLLMCTAAAAAAGPQHGSSACNCDEPRR